MGDSIASLTSTGADGGLKTSGTTGGSPPTVILLVESSNIGAVDDTWVQQGVEINMIGYNRLAVYVEFIVNDSLGNQIQIFSKTEALGAVEYVTALSSDYQKTLGDDSINVVYPFETDGNVISMRIESKATDVISGAGVDEGTLTIKIVRSWV